MKRMRGTRGRGSVSRILSLLTAALILMGIEGELLIMYPVSAILMVMGGGGELLNVNLDRLRVKHKDNYALTCGPLVNLFF